MQDRHDEEMGWSAAEYAPRVGLLPRSNMTGGSVSVREDPWAGVIAQVQSDLENEVVADAAEILVAEQALTTLTDRLRPGAGVSITVWSGTVVRGIVCDVVDGFVDVVADDGDVHLINLDAVDILTGMAGSLASSDRLDIRVRWSTIVRALEGETVRVDLRSGRQLLGRIGTVGADHVDLLADTGCLTVATSAITRLRRPHRMGAS